tara:strand:- start:9606 stop:10850 length:1245 start_codon:yes stop_codon:yes gene_type:complete
MSKELIKESIQENIDLKETMLSGLGVVGFALLAASTAVPVIAIGSGVLLAAANIKTLVDSGELLHAVSNASFNLTLGHVEGFIDGLIANAGQWLPAIPFLAGTFKTAASSFFIAFAPLLGQIITPLLAAMFLKNGIQLIRSSYKEEKEINKRRNEIDLLENELNEARNKMLYNQGIFNQQLVENQSKLQELCNKITHIEEKLELKLIEIEETETLIKNIQDITNPSEYHLASHQDKLEILKEEAEQLRQDKIDVASDEPILNTINDLIEKQDKTKSEIGRLDKNIEAINKEKVILSKKSELARNKRNLGIACLGLAAIAIVAIPCTFFCPVALPFLFVALSAGAALAFGYYKKAKIGKIEKEIKNLEVDNESEDEGEGEIKHVKSEDKIINKDSESDEDGEGDIEHIKPYHHHY